MGFRLAPVALIMALAAMTGGCGYTLAGRGSLLPADIKTVAILELSNRSPITGLEARVTQKIRDEFIGRRKYHVVSDATGADAVLTGEIVNVTQVPAGTTSVQLASRYRFTMTLKVTFTDTRKNTNVVLWSNDALVLTEEYQVDISGPGAGALVNQQSSSFERMANDIAKTVVAAITEAF
jgi:outer membrane lipopolysaccharide assembly protein LptE/RlpB